MAAVRELQVGDNFGNYVLERKLGEGGWGEVWLARHARLSHKAPVAIKFVLRPRPKELERFEREVAILDRLRENRHIIKAEDYGQQDGVPYLVMEYAPGGGLSARIREGLPLNKIADYLTQAANGLDYAHQFNIIHRDLKPSNILFSADGSLLLADFGIAHEDSFELTESGVGMGTPEYMSPEQFNDAKRVGITADIYSLGVIAFQMLCHRLPFGSRREGRSLYQVMTGHVTAPVPQLSEINPNLPIDLQHIIEKALAKEPEQRYQSAEEFAAAFRAVLTESEPTEALIIPENFVQSQLMANTAPVPGQTPSGVLPSPSVSPSLVTPTPPPVIPGSATPTVPSAASTEQTPVTTGTTLPSKGKNQLIVGSVAGLGVLVIALVIVLTLVLVDKSGANKSTETATVAANPATNQAATVPNSPALATTSSTGNAVTSRNTISSAANTTKTGITAVQFAPETAGIPIYPGMKKYELTSDLLKQYEATLNLTGSGGLAVNEVKVAVYTTGDEVSKLKDFYKDELEKAGWTSLTTLATLSVAQASRNFILELEKAGGFVLIYQKGNQIITMFGGPSQIARIMGFNDVAPNEIGLVINLGTLASNSPAAVTSNANATTTPVSTIIGAITTTADYPTLAVYPGLKKVEVTSTFFEQAKKLTGTSGTLTKADIYTTSDTSPNEISKIKTFYKNELEKTGWKDITSLVGAISGNRDMLTQVESLGGFVLLYNGGKSLAINILAVPGTLAQAAGLDTVNAKDFVIAIFYGTFGTNP